MEGECGCATDEAADVDDGDLVRLLGVRVLLPRGLTDEAPHFVEVDGGAVELVLRLVEVPHTHLAEVARVILVEVDAVVVLASGITSTTWMLAVLTHSTVPGAHVAALLAVLLQSRHLHSARQQWRISVSEGER